MRTNLLPTSLLVVVVLLLLKLRLFLGIYFLECQGTPPTTTDVKAGIKQHLSPECVVAKAVTKADYDRQLFVRCARTHRTYRCSSFLIFAADASPRLVGLRCC